MSLRSTLLVLVATAALLLAPSVASASWTVPPTPNVDGALSTNLLAVDCSSANSCMAVGNELSGEFVTATLAERWDGTGWQILPTPNEPGATTSWLKGVSCPRPSVCFAVGSSDDRPLIELWDGTRWSIQPSPEVGDGGLSAVSCSGLLACTAVGTVPPSGTTLTNETLAERWDGTGWHVQPTPNPAGPRESFAGVSCPLKRTCTAVGGSSAGCCGVGSPLVERWFGRVDSWGLQAAPKPDGAESASLAGVSCPDGPVCFAVGQSISQSDPSTPTVYATLAERRIGSTWSVMPTPNPQESRFVQLLSVSCPGRRVCHAVGNAQVPGSLGIPIAERFDGANWQLESVPAPPLPFPFLAGVSCPNRRFCMAVGGYNLRFFGGTLSAKWTP